MRVMLSLVQDVAATASHVLNETGPVVRETRERVLRAARELNYLTNASARLLARWRNDAAID